MSEDPTAATPEGQLFVVSTPIGNREDITLRALRVLKEVALIAAEDTRHTGRLLEHHGIRNRLISYHEHNESERTPQLLDQLKAGTQIALVTNAGTPMVSDPGYRLIRTAIENSIDVVPIPGASAVMAALSVAGLPTDAFVFEGFTARKKNQRREQLLRLAKEPRTVIFYESPRRLIGLLEEMIEVLGDRQAVLAREMTKRHEEILRGSLTEIENQLRQRQAVKGECTLLLQGATLNPEVSPSELEREIRSQLKQGERKLSEIVADIAKQYGVSRNKVYANALQIKKEL